MKITYLGLLLLVASLLVLKIRAEEENSTSLDNKPANSETEEFKDKIKDAKDIEIGEKVTKKIKPKRIKKKKPKSDTRSKGETIKNSIKKANKKIKSLKKKMSKKLDKMKKKKN